MKLRSRLRSTCRVAVPYAVSGIVALWLLLTHIVSLAPRLSPGELATLHSSRSLSGIAANPLFAPMKLLVWLAHFAPDNLQILAARLPSVLLALLALATFTFILHRWHGRRSMIFGFILFISSVGYLHAARFTGFDILYLAAMLGLLAVHIGLHDNEESSVMWFVWLGVDALVLFVPGMAWFVVLSALWQWRAISRVFRRLNLWQRVLSMLLPLVAFGTIAQSIVRSPNLLFAWLGLPSQVGILRNLPHALLDTILAIGYRGTAQPEQWLGRLPLVDIFTLVMALAGVAFYARHWRASRTHLLASYLALSMLLVSLGTVRLSLILPIIYILAVAGIAYTLHFWLERFPQNPIARVTGIGIMSAVIALSCYYNLVQYFVAWPHNPDTVAVYRPKE